VTHYFLDSSALMKRYVSEQGTNWVSAISSPSTGNTITIAPVTQIEVFSGVSRRRREQIITPRGARMIRLLLKRHVLREYQLVEITTHLIATAQDLLDKHPLCAYDSVQLASALIANMRLTGSGLAPLIFVSADTRLLTAATAEGLAVDDPNVHP
jgi:uncharacterized protein